MLTERQLSVLSAIHHSIVLTGMSPTYQDLCDELGLASVGNVNRHINGLVERGFLRRTPRKARAIEVVKLPASMGGVCT